MLVLYRVPCCACCLCMCCTQFIRDAACALRWHVSGWTSRREAERTGAPQPCSMSRRGWRTRESLGVVRGRDALLDHPCGLPGNPPEAGTRAARSDAAPLPAARPKPLKLGNRFHRPETSGSDGRGSGAGNRKAGGRLQEPTWRGACVEPEAWVGLVGGYRGGVAC